MGAEGDAGSENKDDKAKATEAADLEDQYACARVTLDLKRPTSKKKGSGSVASKDTPAEDEDGGRGGGGPQIEIEVIRRVLEQNEVVVDEADMGWETKEDPETKVSLQSASEKSVVIATMSGDGVSAWHGTTLRFFLVGTVSIKLDGDAAAAIRQQNFRPIPKSEWFDFALATLKTGVVLDFSKTHTEGPMNTVEYSAVLDFFSEYKSASAFETVLKEALRPRSTDEKEYAGIPAQIMSTLSAKVDGRSVQKVGGATWSEFTLTRTPPESQTDGMYTHTINTCSCSDVSSECTLVVVGGRA
jgi:hypothetical protein